MLLHAADVLLAFYAAACYVRRYCHGADITLLLMPPPLLFADTPDYTCAA